MEFTILKEIREIKSTRKELRDFGIVMGVAFLLIAGFIYWKSAKLNLVIFALSAIFALLGVAAPGVLKPIQKVWMSIAVVMGWMVSRVILFVLFYAVLTPISVLAKLFGESFLDLKMNDGKATYWVDRRTKEFQKKQYERQF